MTMTMTMIETFRRPTTAILSPVGAFYPPHASRAFTDCL